MKQMISGHITLNIASGAEHVGSWLYTHLSNLYQKEKDTKGVSS